MKQNYRNIIFGRTTFTYLVNNSNEIVPNDADRGIIAMVKEISILCTE